MHGHKQPPPTSASVYCELQCARCIQQLLTDPRTIAPQAEATTAAMRADYDAKIAELMADLEGTRGEKEKTDTDLAILKASARKERLQWNKERTLLSRKVAEAEARAREASDGVASPEEFTTLQKALANGEATIRSLREALEVEETRRDKLQFEVACASTAEADVERLMVLVASLEKQLAEEREAKKCAEQEAEARSADARGLERRLKAAVEAAALAEHSAAKCIEDAGKITAEVHDARATQRHAELWLEKSLAEVDAVHALLAYERSVAAGAADTSMHVPHQFDRSMQTPLLQPPSPASDSADSHAAFAGMRPEMAEVVRDGRVGTGAQTPSPDSPTSMLAALAAAPSAGSIDGHAGGTTAAAVAGAVVAPVAAHTTPTSRGRSQGSRSGSQTPELDGTRPVLYSGTRLRTRMGGAGRGMGMDGDDEVPTTAAMRGGGGGGRGGVGVFSPPTPTVLFGELAGDGGSTTTTWEKACTLGLEGPPRHPANGNATSGAVVAHARILVDSGSGNSAYCHGSTLGLAKPGRAMAMTTTTTAKKNEEVGGGGGGGEENTMAALLSLLRLETSKREEVQARATELEGAIAVVAQEAAAAVRRAESLAPPAHHCQRKEEEEEEAARTSSAGGRGSELCPCLHVHGSGASTATAGGSAGGGGCGGWGRTRQPQAGVRGAAPQPENLSPPDPHATFVRLDQDRQVAKILGLVREARTKLEVAAGCGVSVNASEDRGRGGREKTQGKAARAGRGTSFPTDETEINSWNGLNPTIEVASLIEQLEGELKRSADDNAQLREFCTHLEGLLAAPGDRNDDGVAGAGAGGGRAGGGAGTTYGISAGAAVGGGCNGWGPSTAVGSNHPTGDGASPFAVRRGSFGERRKGAPLPGSFQDLC